MKLVVIIPTYNEKTNIGRTIDDLETVFKQLPASAKMHILVIDDQSPDGTAEVVKVKAKEYGNITLLVNPNKAGLGAAYVKAFKYALDKLSSDAVFEYDADGSHQPQYIPGMINELIKGADVVVGSRYIPGGSMPQDWGIGRKLTSFIGNLICRTALLTWQYRDMTSGFRLTKTKWLKKIDLDQLLSKQFAYKIHLYYALHSLGAKIVEFPIAFIDRSRGDSKFPRNNIKDSLRVVFTLAFRAHEKLVKVMLVGAVGTIVQLLFFNLLRPFFNLNLAQNLAIEMAVISNFSLNNLWTFSTQKFTFGRIGELVKGFIKFNLASLGSIIIQNVVLIVGVKLLGSNFWIENGLIVTGILIGLIWNYIMYTKVVWQK